MLLSLGMIILNAPRVAMANDSQGYISPSSAPAMIDEQQLVAAFNVALQDPKIRKQLKKQLMNSKQESLAVRESYEKMMMAANLDLMDKMAKKLEPKKEEKKEKTMLQDGIALTKDLLGQTAKLTVPYLLSTWIFISVLSRMPVARHIVKMADTAAGGTSWFVEAMIGSEEIVTVAASTCPTVWAWIMTLGNCAPEVVATVLQNATGIA